MKDKTHSRKKERTRERVIDGMLSYGDIRVAVQNTGMSERTYRRYLDNPDVLAEYHRRRRQRVETTLGMMDVFLHSAIATLARCLNSPNPHVQVKAAQTVIAESRKGLETAELLARFERLEDETE